MLCATAVSARVSIGFNDDPVMVGADAVVGEPVAGAVREYYLGGKDLPLLKLQSMQDLRNTSIGQRDGVTVMQFTRALDPAAVASASGQHRRLRSGSSSRQLSDGTSTKGNVPITARGQTAVVYVGRMPWLRLLCADVCRLCAVRVPAWCRSVEPGWREQKTKIKK